MSLWKFLKIKFCGVFFLSLFFFLQMPIKTEPSNEALISTAEFHKIQRKSAMKLKKINSHAYLGQWHESRLLVITGRWVTEHIWTDSGGFLIVFVSKKVKSYGFELAFDSEKCIIFVLPYNMSVQSQHSHSLPFFGVDRNNGDSKSYTADAYIGRISRHWLSGDHLWWTNN